MGGGENRPLCRNRLLTGYSAAESDLAAETLFFVAGHRFGGYFWLASDLQPLGLGQQYSRLSGTRYASPWRNRLFASFGGEKDSMATGSLGSRGGRRGSPEPADRSVSRPRWRSEHAIRHAFCPRAPACPEGPSGACDNPFSAHPHRCRGRYPARARAEHRAGTRYSATIFCAPEWVKALVNASRPMSRTSSCTISSSGRGRPSTEISKFAG